MKRTGTLPKYALLDLLRSLRAERFTGFGDLESRDDQVRVYVHDGEVVFARSSALRHSLPAYLLSQHLVGRHQLKELLEESRRSHLRLESLLLSHGVLDNAALRDAHGSLARYVLSFSFGLHPASYALLPTPPPAAAPPYRLSVEEAFFRFVATRDTAEEEASLLRDCFGVKMVRTSRYDELRAIAHATFAHGNGAVGETADDHGAPLELDAIDGILATFEAGTATVSKLLEGGHDAFDVIRRVFALNRAGLLRFESDEAQSAWLELAGQDGTLTETALGQPSSPGGAAVKPTGPAPAGPTPSGPIDLDSAADQDLRMPLPHLPRAESGPESVAGGASRTRRTRSNVTELPRTAAPDPVEQAPRHPAEKQLLATWSAMREANLYEALGLMPDAPLSTVRHQFRNLRLRYDPGAFAGIELSREAAAALRTIAERLELAYRTLSDFGKRSAYHVSQDIDPRTLRVSLRALFEAEALLTEAMQSLRDGLYPEATAALREANALSPFDAAVRAELAWAVFLSSRRGPTPTDVKSTVSTLLREAQELDSRNEAVLRIRARVARMEGRMREALEGYQRLLAIHPHSREAARSIAEIRALLNRPATSPASASAAAADMVDGEEIDDAMEAGEIEPPDTDPDPSGGDGGVVHRITGLFRRK